MVVFRILQERSPRVQYVTVFLRLRVGVSLYYSRSDIAFELVYISFVLMVWLKTFCLCVLGWSSTAGIPKSFWYYVVGARLRIRTDCCSQNVRCINLSSLTTMLYVRNSFHFKSVSKVIIIIYQVAYIRAQGFLIGYTCTLIYWKKEEKHIM